MNSTAKKILCIGNICVDVKAYSPENDDSEAYRDGTIEIMAGGVGRGMALNLKQLGMDSAILTMVGKDIFGDFLTNELTKKKIDTTLLRVNGERRTSLFSVMKSGEGRASCIYNTDIIQSVEFDEEAKEFVRSKCMALVMDSNLSPEAFEEIYAFKKQNPDIFTFQNATAPDLARKTLAYADLIDLFACNEFEAASIIGETAVPDLSVAEKFTELGFKNFIITFGEQGVLVHAEGKTYIEPPYAPQHIVDTIGAGDAFASGFLMGFLEKSPVKRCIHYGLAAAKETLLTKQTVSDLLSREVLENYPAEEK